MTRMLAHDQKEPSTMGLTSTAEHRPDDDAMGCDFVRPIHGITVRTDLEFQVEDLREEEEMRRLEPVVLGGMPRAPRKTIGWAGVCPIRSREAKAAGKDRA